MRTIFSIKFKSVLLTALIVAGCSDDILYKSNPNNLTADTFFKNDAQAFAAVKGAYAALQTNNLYCREYFFTHDVLSDDNQTGGAQLEAARAQLLNHTAVASNSLIESTWRGFYRTVNRANLVIEQVGEMTVPDQITQEAKDRYVAEGKFLRAWSYFELVSLWGPVPLLTTVADSPNGFERSEEALVYALIFADLDEAIPYLPLRKDVGLLGRVTKSAAQALAAKAHMFRGEYSEALDYLTPIITSGEHSLVPRFLDNFEEETENNIESVFEVQFSSDFGSDGAWSANGAGASECTFRAQEYSPIAWRNLIPSDEVVAEFEAGDPRNNFTFYRIGDTYNNGALTLTSAAVQGDNTKPSWRKYQNIYKRDTEKMESGINFRAIRYADVLLMAAECENDAGNSAKAIDYMNQVRDRADVMMPHYPTATYPCGNKDQVLDAIQHERRVELAGEQVRNRDIRRWRRQSKLDSEPIKGWSAKWDLLPLPLQEIDNNSALDPSDQNAGH